MSEERIYLSAPHMGGEEERFVAEAFRTNWLSSVGPNLDGFEADLAGLVGAPAVALTSGTAAMHLGLRLLGVGPGDEVVCPSLTFIASANPIVYLGARPVFVDSERTSWNIDPALLASFLAERRRYARLPKAVVVVHLYGQSANLGPLLACCSEHGVPVLEDAAEALGTHYEGTQVGAFGTVGVLSFNGNKIITTTGGGALVTPNRAWVEKARFWSTQARDPGVAYEHTEHGYNYRLSNVLAGIGRGQLRVLEQRVAERRAIAFKYRDAFADLDGLSLMPQAPWGRHTNWLSVFLVDEARLGCSRDAIIEALAKQNVEARPVWKPMHLQRVWNGVKTVGGAVAEDLFRRGLCLPSSTNLTDAQHGRVIDLVRRTVRAERERRSAVHA